MPRLRLSPGQVEDLRAFIQLGDETIESVSHAIAAMDSTALRAEFVQAAVASATTPDVANNVVPFVMSLASLTLRIGVNPVVSGLSEYIEDKGALGQLEILLRLPAVVRAAKVIDLSYEYANLFRTGRIMTDIRPLFDEVASQVEGAVVSHTLRLHYDSVEGDHSLSIAMDEADVQNLRDQCDRALAKAKLSKSLMTDAGVATIMSGEEES